MSYKNVLSRKIIIRLIGLLVIACVLFADAAALFGSSDRRDGRVKRWNRFNPDARPRTFRRMMDPETARAVGLEKKGCPSEECPECPTCPEPIVCGDDTMLEVLFDESDVGSPKAVAAVERLQKGQCIPSAPVVTCGEGSSLIDGECIPSYPETSCGEGTMLVDGECVPASQPVTCGEGTTLVGGECVCADEVEVPACIDTDGGEDIFVKGNTTGVWDFYGAGSTTVSSHQDYCRSNYGTVNGLPKCVGEYYCNDDDRKSEKYYDCPNGCEDGVCVPDEVPEAAPGCTDTDGVEDLYVKGNT
ncbi:MAG: hypothetical protein QGG50_05615, partial [Methanopyri archaeon]|nr:hypothetical protein [Methanopyri archaeon]